MVLMLTIIRSVFALVLIFFIPGYFLVMAMFPRKGELDKDFDNLYKYSLAVGLSIVITIMLSFVLNQLGASEVTGMGYYTTGYIILSLFLLSLFFFFLGWWRGAFPRLGEWHPAFIRNPPPDPRSLVGIPIRDKKKAFRYRQLANEKYAVIDRIDDVEKKEKSHSGRQKEYYREKRQPLRQRLEDIEAELLDIENSEGII